MTNFKLKQSTYINHGESSLVKQLVADLASSHPRHPFTITKIIVPTQALAIWLKDKLAQAYGICANIDCVVLPGPVLQQIYQLNHPTAQFFEFEHARFILYDLLLKFDFDTEIQGLANVRDYLYDSPGQISLSKAFQLASQLQQLFLEYMFLRPQQLANGSLWQLDPQIAWQQLFWHQLYQIIQQSGQLTFLEVYAYFTQTKPSKLPLELNLFALPSIFPAQLDIILHLSQFIPVNWYHLAVSNHYYGDLLDHNSRQKLERKLLGYPQLALDDLYLMDGNPLVANLGQQSRELVELLLRNCDDFEPSGAVFNLDASSASPRSLLQLLQFDIRNLTNRIAPEFRLTGQAQNYANPVPVSAYDESLLVNICHNRMREVQVLFNFVAASISQQHDLRISDILVTAPDIDEYVAYLNAVFSEEYLLTSQQQPLKIRLNITGNREHNLLAWLKTVQLLLNVPYHLPVSYLLDLVADSNLMMSLSITKEEIDLIKKWLSDNHTHFGYTEADYQALHYPGLDLFSLQRLLLNLSLGLLLPPAVIKRQQPLATYSLANQNGVAVYDNIEIAQSELLDKLIKLIQLMVEIRNHLYSDPVTYRELSTAQTNSLLTLIFSYLKPQAAEYLSLERLLSKLPSSAATRLNLLVINQLLAEFAQEVSSRIRFSGALTCASLANMRDIPFKVIYVLGMNANEFPRQYSESQLSYLSRSWRVGDRNYNLEDKQLFLSTILAAQQQLVFSYIGRSETKNEPLDPCSVLSLLLDVVRASSLDGDATISRICQVQPLHPFLSSPPNIKLEYSHFWQQVRQIVTPNPQDQRWKATTKVEISNLSPRLQQQLFQPQVRNLVATLRYSNYNLHQILNLTNFEFEYAIADEPDLELSNYRLANQLWQEFEQLGSEQVKNCYATGELADYLRLRGIIAHAALGETQLTQYYQMYLAYVAIGGDADYQLEYRHACGLVIQDKLRLCQGKLLIKPSFSQLKFTPPTKSAAKLDCNLAAEFLVWSWLLTSPNTQILTMEGKPLTERPVIEVVNFKLTGEGKINTYQLDYQIPDMSKLEENLVNYYLTSLTSRTLFHKAAILGYQPGEKAKLYATLLAEDRNYGLDQLRHDPLWQHEIDNYPLVVANFGADPLLELAEIYAQVKINGSN